MYSLLKLWFVVAIVAVAVTTVWTDNFTPAEQCPGEHFDDLRDKIQVIPCGKTRCKLPKDTNITVILKFLPNKEVKSLKNNVHAEIAGIPLPFVGVAGTSACGQITHADTGKPAACPLAAGKEYIYTNVFPVLSVYPIVSMRVHWGLYDGTNNVICFEVPAVITNKSAKKKSQD